MIAHVIPKIFNNYIDIHHELLNISFPELGLHLVNGEHLALRKPYPNKIYHVACKKIGKKAVNGIFIEVPDNIDTFKMITKWRLDAELEVTHIVNFKISDKEHPYFTQDPALWFAHDDGSQGDIWPVPHQIPCYFSPCMSVIVDGNDPNKEGDCNDVYNEEGWLVLREENYKVPSISEANLFGKYNSYRNRMPALKDRFKSESTSLLSN